jgi:2-oxoisovalerate dehydrogenase E1 component alpha subunit
LNSQGKVINPSDDPGFDKEDLIDMYQAMVKTSIMDRILYQSQRQGSYLIENIGKTYYFLMACSIE